MVLNELFSEFEWNAVIAKVVFIVLSIDRRERL